MRRNERIHTPRYSLVPVTLAAVLLAGACAKRFRAEGLVTAVDRAGGTVTISHREIRGYMPAMVMPFRLERPETGDRLRPGDRVRFVIRKAALRDVRVIETKQNFPLPEPAERIGIGDAVPDFELTDQMGRAVRLSDSRGRVVAIDFIYTRCPLPDVCPRLSAAFAFAGRALRNQPVTFLSVTVDPQYDTPQVLNAYARRWRAVDDTWRFLTGPMGRVREVAGYFGLVFWPEENMISHTVTTAVVDQRGRLAAIIQGSSFRPVELRDLIAGCLNGFGKS